MLPPQPSVHCLLILVKMILVKTFDTTDKRVIPLQLVHSVVSPFFGIFTIRPLCQSSGICSSCHMCENKTKSTSEVVSRSAFSSSAGMSSQPGALLFFSCFIAFRISPLLIGSELMSSSGTLTPSRGGLRGSSLLSISLKCSAHRFSWSSTVVKMLPFKSLIVVEFCWDLQETLLVIFYSFLLSFTFAASSASFALFSM